MKLSSTMGAAGFGVMLFGASVAHAEERLSDAGRFAVSAERLFGVAWSSQSVGQSGQNVSTSETQISLLSKTGATPYSAPRIGFDYFVINGLSLGAALGYSTTSVSESVGGQSQDLLSLHGLVLAPRVGYAYMFNQTVGLWPRLGVTYFSVSESPNGGGKISEDGVALSLEVPLVIAPVPHVAFTLAPTLDYGVSGSLSVATTATVGTGTAPVAINGSTDTKPIEVGLQAGMTVWF